ncbi:PQQ-dependent sugar dehydrogenase [Microbacter sp. GSS18]|nr:PQQ-dependent sugar dehydrogenase [Microbacter sp. GSS18]
MHVRTTNGTPRGRSRPLKLALGAAALVGAIALAGCTGAGMVAPPQPSPSGLAGPDGEPVEVVTDLQAPWSIVFVDDIPLVSERDSGRILEVSATGDTRVVGTVAETSPGGEGGLLGLAVDEQRRLYAYSTGPDGNRVQRFALIGGPGAMSLGPAETVLAGIPSARFHNGGRLAFGPDGMLYIATGDARDGAAAQDPDALSGKILRVTADGEVPADNPFPGSAAYSLGHRNVQGLAWADDGTMFASEFGQDTWDELNIIEPGGNYGWPEVEGIAGVEGFIDPVQQWNPDQASPSGIAIAQGAVFIANLRGSVLRAVSVSDPAAWADHFSGEFGRLRDAVVAPDGTLWVLTNNTDGRGAPRDGDDRILSVPLAP